MKSRNIAYIPQLDHMRLVAALLVFGFHFFHYYWGNWVAYPNLFWAAFITEGHTGVSLFFVLSGFIFMSISLAGGNIRYGPFLRNRLLRIAPLFLVVFMVAISVGRDRFAATDILYLLFTNLGDAPTSWHFMTGPAWSISIEFTFYLVFPFLAISAHQKGVPYLLKLLALLLVLKIASYLAVPNSTHMLYSTIIGRFDQFVIGMMAAIIYSNRRHWLEKYARVILLVGGVALGAALSAQARWASFFFLEQKQPFWIVWSGIEATLWSVVLIGYLAGRFSLPVWLNLALNKGGEWSYSIYMWHALIIYATHTMFWRIGESSPLITLVTIISVGVATIAFSWLSFTTIEQPFLRLRERYTER